MFSIKFSVLVFNCYCIVCVCELIIRILFAYLISEISQCGGVFRTSLREFFYILINCRRISVLQFKKFIIDKSIDKFVDLLNGLKVIHKSKSELITWRICSIVLLELESLTIVSKQLIGFFFVCVKFSCNSFCLFLSHFYCCCSYSFNSVCIDC